jgi:hypothetical protein
MKTVRDYLEDIKMKIVMSEIVKSMTIVTERTLSDRGYQEYIFNRDLV